MQAAQRGALRWAELLRSMMQPASPMHTMPMVRDLLMHTDATLADPNSGALAAVRDVDEASPVGRQSLSSSLPPNPCWPHCLPAVYASVPELPPSAFCPSKVDCRLVPAIAVLHQ